MTQHKYHLLVSSWNFAGAAQLIDYAIRVYGRYWIFALLFLLAAAVSWRRAKPLAILFMVVGAGAAAFAFLAIVITATCQPCP